MDPADEFHSPYLYVGNNPVNLVDPDGAQAYSFLGTSAYEIVQSVNSYF